MLPDFEMITHQMYGGHDITIFPISDVHLGSQDCMEQEFIAFCKQLKETTNAYVLLLGDLIDNGLRNSLTNCYKATMSPSIQKREMANILEPIKDRILCILPGNHEARSRKESDDDPCYDIAVKLDLETIYRENIAFIKIQMGEERGENGAGNGYARPTYVLTAIHGSGGGVLYGGALNNSTRFGYTIDGTDILVLGHTHKPYTTQPGKISIDPRNNVVSIKPFKIVSSTSWLKYGGYAAQKMLMPSTHCLNRIILSGKSKEILVTM